MVRRFSLVRAKAARRVELLDLENPTSPAPVVSKLATHVLLYWKRTQPTSRSRQPSQIRNTAGTN